MKHNLGIAVLGICFVVGGFVRAEAQGGASAGKVGYMDIQTTLLKTTVGKKAKKRLENTKAKKQKELDNKQKALQKAASGLEKKRAVLTPAALQSEQQKLQKRYVALQETYMTLQQDLAKQEAELVKEILNKAAPVIKSVAKQKGYTMIVDKNSVLWADSKFDITAAVNKQLK